MTNLLKLFRLFNKTNDKLTINEIDKQDGQMIITESGELYVDFSNDNRIKIGIAEDDVNKLLDEETAKLYYYGTTDIEITPENDFTFDGDTLTEYTGTAEAVVIPYKVNDTLITCVDNYAFHNCSSLTSITIPNSVTSIGNSAFNGCENLTSITIPNSVTSMGRYIFKNCSSLTSITIGNSVTSIDIFAFENCSNLTSINIPNSVTTIDNSAFDSCSSLTSITIPDSVTSIGNSVFIRCSNLTSVNMSNSVTSIGVDAFRYCGKLTNITIPNSVTSIGNYAFCACRSLTNITIPNSVTSIGNEAFYGCDKLTSITIGNGVTSIGNEAFYGCDKLTSITIGNGVTSIGVDVFNLISKNAVFYVEQDSYAETWCKENNKNYKYTIINSNINNNTSLMPATKFISLASNNSYTIPNYSSNDVHVYAELYDSYNGRAQNHLVKIEETENKTYFATSTSNTTVNISLNSSGKLQLNSINSIDESLTNIYFSIMYGSNSNTEVIEDYQSKAITYVTLSEGQSKTINDYSANNLIIYAELYDSYIEQFSMVRIVEGSNTYFATSTNGTTCDITLDSSTGKLTLASIDNTNDSTNLTSVNFILMTINNE